VDLSGFEMANLDLNRAKMGIFLVKGAIGRPLDPPSCSPVYHQIQDIIDNSLHTFCALHYISDTTFLFL